MSLRRLLQEWRMRLAAHYARSADPVPGTEWLVSIRIRILSYFLSRYADAPEIWRPRTHPRAGSALPGRSASSAIRRTILFGRRNS